MNETSKLDGFPPGPTYAIGCVGNRYHLLGATMVPGIDRHPVFVRLGERDWATEDEVSDVIDDINPIQKAQATADV